MRESILRVVAFLFLGWAGLVASAHGDDLQKEIPSDLTIVAPSLEGGGWDLTAQAMKIALEAEGIVDSVEIVRSPGAGGLIGLAQFSASRDGDNRSLLVGGLFMLGAAQRSAAEVSVLDTTPIARLTEDYEVIAVPQSSPYRTLDDLLDAMRLNLDVLRWAGGSSGGPDQLVVWQLAHALELDTGALHYTPFSGGSRVAAHLADERFAIGVSGYSEFAEELKRGSIRALAISSKDRLQGIDIPTFEEFGIVGLSFSNWRGVFAPPNISDADRLELEAIVRRMVESRTWREMLKRFQWEPAYLDSSAFSEFVVAEERRVSTSDPFAGGKLDARLLPSAKARRIGWIAVLAGGMVLLVAVIWWQRKTNCRRESELNRTLEQLALEAEQRTREIEQRAKQMEDKLAGMSAQIEREFERWGLTAAERSVAHLMLKGLRLKDIAKARNTSDRTVRQQAQAIYKKAGIEGRSDLAAYFMEDFLGPQDTAPTGAQAAPTSRPVAKPVTGRIAKVSAPSVGDPGEAAPAKPKASTPTRARSAV